MSTVPGGSTSIRLLSVAIAGLMVASVAAAVTMEDDDDGVAKPLAAATTTTTTEADVTTTTEVGDAESGIDPSGGTGGSTTTTVRSGGAAPAPGSPTAPLRTTTTARSSPTTTQDDTPPTGSEAATASDPGLYTVSPTGQSLNRIRAGGYSFISWSPTAAKLAYGVPAGSPPRVEVINANGTGLQRVVAGNLVAPPAWSPDGNRLALVLQNGNASDLHLIGIDGSGQRAITSSGTVSGVSWSRTGTLAFLSNGNVYTASVDGSGVSPIITPGNAYRAVTWSPDGNRLAYAAGDEVWVSNPQGTDAKKVAGTDSHILSWSQLTWSADSTRVAFQAGTGGASYVMVVGHDGSGLHSCADQAMSPDWSPTSNRIAIYTAGKALQNGDRESNLELADADRRTFRQRVVNDKPGANQSSGPSYSADGSMIAFVIGGGDRGGPPPPSPPE